jgi:hypothetical protein
MNTIIQNDVLLFMAVILAPFGVELVHTNLWGGLAVCAFAAALIFVRTFFKIDTAKKAGTLPK